MSCFRISFERAPSVPSTRHWLPRVEIGWLIKLRELQSSWELIPRVRATIFRAINLLALAVSQTVLLGTQQLFTRVVDLHQLGGILSYPRRQGPSIELWIPFQVLRLDKSVQELLLVVISFQRPKTRLASATILSPRVNFRCRIRAFA